MKKNENLDEEKICNLYSDGNSLVTISKIYNVSTKPIFRILKKHHIKTRRVGHPKIYKCNENIFQENTEQSFYLAGFIAADGTIKKQKYSNILKISLSAKDKSHLEKIQKLLDNDSPIKLYSYKPKNNIIVNNNALYEKYSYVELTITSSKICKDLERFNIVSNKTYKYDLPEWLVQHPMFNHFIRGYIDGDGTISSSLRKKYNKPQISLSLIGNYEVLLKINNAFVKIGANNSKINHKPNTKQTYKIRYGGNIQLQKIGKFLYKNSTIHLDRKFNNIKSLL